MPTSSWASPDSFPVTKPSANAPDRFTTSVPHGKLELARADTSPVEQKARDRADGAEHADAEDEREAHVKLARRTRLVATATARKPATMLAAA